MAVEFKDYYRILGVDRGADDKTLKSAYRKLARKYHPDVNKGQDARFKEINEAYEVLSDPEKRRRYDTLGPDWQRHAPQGAPTGPGGFQVEYGEGGDFSEFFRTIFGDLGGRGARGGGGSPGPLGGRRARGGVAVGLPAGVRTGQKVRVSGEGGGGTGGRGDLYLVVSVAPHPQFERKGDDVHLTLPITAPEAALGATIEVPTLRGKVSMKIPPATSSGRTFRLPGYGMPRLKGGGAGDELVTVRIMMPAELTAAEKELYERLRALRTDSPRGYAHG